MNEDKLISMVLENREAIREIKEILDTEMVKKTDLRDMQDTLDTVVGLLKKHDQETTMQTSGMKRHEERIENLEDDVGRIMPLVGLA